MIQKLSFSLLRQERTLKRRLFIYMLFLTGTLLLTLVSGLFLFGRFSNPQKELYRTLDLQMEVFARDMEAYWDDIAAMSLHLSEHMTATLEWELGRQGLAFSELNDNEEALDAVQEDLIEPLCQYLRQTNCSGAFVMLDATVNAALPDSNTSRSGLYIEKSSRDNPDNSLLLYHGVAEIGKRHGVMPHRKWRQEFDTRLFPDYSACVSAAESGLSGSYYLTNLTTLPRTSEQVSLMTVPLIGSDGTLYGLCGFEISQSWFKTEHAQPSNLQHLVCLFTAGNDTPDASTGFSSGIQDGYYLAPKGALSISALGNGLVALSGETDSYVGVIKSLTVTRQNPAYTLAVMMPRSDYRNSMLKSRIQLLLLALLVIFFASVSCLYFSRRFLSPVLTALEQIRANQAREAHSDIPEISNLLDFLAQRDLENEEALLGLEQQMARNQEDLDRLQAEHAAIQQEYDAAQTELSRLAYSRKNEVDPDDYQRFLECLNLLTAKEKLIFDLYIQGYSSKEILTAANINENTLKYHNKNIYSKLGVKSRKQLLMYAALMKQDM